MTVQDLDALKAWIGREERGTDVVTPELAARFHATLGLGGEAAHFGQPAPRLIHWCLAQPAVSGDGLGQDGHPRKGGFLPPVSLPRRMWAGGELRFSGDIRVGDTVERVSRIADITEKSGRTGWLCFVTVAHEISVAGTIVVSERQDIVYREAATASVAISGEPAAVGTVRRDLDATPTLLFRYSALTFNGHRIHYDRPYATGVEHYPGLVVHGPLQATLLFNLAASQAGRLPDRLVFRGQSPLIDGPLSLNAVESNGALKLWTAAPAGPVAMTAEASWI